MTEQAWLQGMRDLLAAFPDKDQDQSLMEHRGRVYRRELAALSDEEWLAAVSAALREEKWFPTIKALLDHAAAERRPPTPEETAIARTEKALARIKKHETN